MSTKVKYRGRQSSTTTTLKTHGDIRDHGFRWKWHKPESKLLRFERILYKGKNVPEEMLEKAAEAVAEGCKNKGVTSARVTTRKKAILVSIEKLGPASKYAERFENLVKEINEIVFATLNAEFEAKAQSESEIAARRRTDHQSFSNDIRRRAPIGTPPSPLPTS